MALTRQFKDLNKNNADLVGGKGASLGEMVQAGIPVPPGFALSAEAFERFITETDINVEIDHLLHKVDPDIIHTIDRASEQIQALIKKTEMPVDIAKEILEQFDDLGAEYVAVRSSATAEDSADAAWAGQLDSFLNTTRDDVLEKVQACWASLFTPRAIFYRFEKDLHSTKISVAVVIQQMVNSEKSGIAFSVHPVTEDRNQLIIEAGFGLGEAIVSGQITPDAYVIEKEPRRILDINVTNQEKGLFRRSSDSLEKSRQAGNEWRELGEGEKQVLSESEIFDLSETILKIEDHYGFPCDIEWAFEKGEFYIVQSRPITTLSGGQDKAVTDKETVKGPEEVVGDDLEKINPQNYFFLETVPAGYPMDVAYINLAHISAPETRYGFDAGSMYLIFEDGGYSIFIEKEKWFNTGRKILKQVLSSDDRIKKWRERFDDWLEEIRSMNLYYKNFNFSELSNKELYDELKKILAFENKNGLEDVELVTTNYGSNLIYQELEKVLKEARVDVNQTTQTLLLATGEFPLLEYEKKVGELALKCLKKGVMKVQSEVLEKDEELNTAIQSLLEKYGWLDASLTNPPKSIDTVLSDINDLLSFGPKLERILAQRDEEESAKRSEKAKLVKDLISTLNDSQKRAVEFVITSSDLGRILVDRIMEFIHYRRQIYPEIGKRLKLTENEVKLMTDEEIGDCLVKNKQPNLELIETRNKITVALIQNNKLHLYTEKKAENISRSLKALLQGDGSSLLKGEVAFSGGKVQGTARIVKDVTEISKISDGDILVSSRTYPDLLPAMKRSTAIIAELGGLLSHAAIVSRELKIPCVVGVKTAIAQIKDGDLLEVDSDKGTIKIIDPETN